MTAFIHFLSIVSAVLAGLVIVLVIEVIALWFVRWTIGQVVLRIRLRRQRKVRAEIIAFEQHRERVMRAVGWVR